MSDGPARSMPSHQEGRGSELAKVGVGPRQMSKGKIVKMAAMGNRAVTTLFMIIRNVRMYDPDNEIFSQPLELLTQTINDVVAADGMFNLQAVGTMLALNGVVIKVDFSSLETLRELTNAFKERDMGGFRVEHPIRIDELKAFLRAFAHTNAPLDDANLPGMVNIRVGRYKLIREAMAHQTDQEINKSRKIDREKYTMTVYARSVAWMTRFLEAIRDRDRLPSMASGSRILRDLIDLAVDQKHTFLGMSATRNSEEYIVYHSVNTCLISILLGNQLGFTKEQLHDLGRAALMHDIGAAFADPSLMDKQGSLTAEERARIKQNPLIAARVLMRTRPLDLAALKSIVAAHESKLAFFLKVPDGQGGFRFQPTKSLGLYARIIKVASTFDALTSARPYREAFAPEIAVQVMLNQMRHDFDPAVLDLLILMLQGSSTEFHGGSDVALF